MADRSPLIDLIEIEDKYQTILNACFDNAPVLFKGERTRLGLSLRKFAKKLGCAHSYLSQIEAGKQKPGKPILLKLGYLSANKNSR